MRVLVTGGAGFIGSHTVDHLLTQGHDVSVVDILEPQVHGTSELIEALAQSGNPAWPVWRNPKADYKLCDIRDTGMMEMILADVQPQVIVHLAAQVGVGQAETDRLRYIDHNVMGTASLLTAIDRHHANAELNLDTNDRVARLVVASSMSCYGEGMYVCEKHGPVRPSLRSDAQMEEGGWTVRCSITDDGKHVCGRELVPTFIPEWSSLRPAGIYAITKRDTEEMALLWGESRGVSVAAARLFNTYGPRQALRNPYTGVVAIFLNQLICGEAPILYEDGWQARDFTHVADVARGLGRLVGVQYRRQAGKAWKRPEAQGSFNIGTGEANTILSVAEVLGELTGSEVEPRITGQFRTGDVRCCYADRGRMMQLGWEPKIDLRDGLETVVAWSAESEGGGVPVQHIAHDELVAAGLLRGRGGPGETA